MRTKLIHKKIIVLLLIMVFLSPHAFSSEKSPSVQATGAGLDLLIKKRIFEARSPLRSAIGGERVYSSVLVEGFYRGRNYQPAWSRNGRLTQTEALTMAVEEAYGDGLTPDYYHLGLIRSLVDKVKKEASPDPARLADLDIILTDAFLTLGCHLSAGCVNPVTIEAEWFAKRGSVDVSSVLEQALRKKQIREELMRLRPIQGSYENLRKVLSRYREISLKGEWPLVAGGPLLKEGSRSERLTELRERLFISGDLVADAPKEGDFFDEKLKQSLIIFQKRHGLMPDGVLGPPTVNALNVPLARRVRQIELNMERLRWILGNMEQRSIVVNIANFQLDVMENGKSILSMKVVVGKPYWRTPVFTAKMTYVVVNPSWNVPDRIARQEVLKKVKNNPRYLAEQNIKVLKGWAPKEEEIDPETVDWSEITPKTLTYHFRQEPGPLNPLGRLKFMFPNTFDVYLHDTPAKSLFSENVRTFSHGCTRIEKPLELGEYVLRNNPEWTQDILLAAIEEGTEKKILISRPLNVHFLYLTAWVDEMGMLQFRNDIYGRDKSLDEALRKKPSLS
ncbi:MAG TPA: L,D-transpeptidase family protein [Thermodesulfovibrionales bacterium]|nr:L,D-transpeptidase family protein [Thermodesulfovibrionales bacterium]